MRKIILLAHISLDGFVAGEKGELDGFESGAENLDFVCQLTEDADAALFGRISYQLLNEYWPTAKNHPGITKEEIKYSNWYNEAEKIVISKTLPNADSGKTTIIRENVVNEIDSIRKQQGKNILIFGSPSVSQLLMRQNMIDSYWIFINPVVFAKGIPLFAGLDHKMKFRLISTQQFPNGEIAQRFDPVS